HSPSMGGAFLSAGAFSKGYTTTLFGLTRVRSIGPAAGPGAGAAGRGGVVPGRPGTAGAAATPPATPSVSTAVARCHLQNMPILSFSQIGSRGRHHARARGRKLRGRDREAAPKAEHIAVYRRHLIPVVSPPHAPEELRTATEAR